MNDVTTLVNGIQELQVKLSKLQSDFTNTMNQYQRAFFDIENHLKNLYDVSSQLQKVDIRSNQASYGSAINNRNQIDETKITQGSDSIDATNSNLIHSESTSKFVKIDLSPSKTPTPNPNEKHRSGRKYSSIITDISVNEKLFDDIRTIVIDVLKHGKNTFNDEEEKIIEKYRFIFDHPQFWLKQLIEEKKRAVEFKQMIS